MSITKKGQRTTHYQHTPQVFERRRSLFPPDTIDSEEESDLGHISPLSFDSDHEDLKHLVVKQGSQNGSLLSKTDSIGDYDILGVVDNVKDSVSTPVIDKNYTCSDTMSPLYLSPFCDKLKPGSESHIINETPAKISPSYSLKTPHDSSNTNSKVPKLARKSLLDTLETTSTKRKLSPLNSPEQSNNKYLKLDPKNSKVRTTLFPEYNISLSTKRFYPKTEDVMEKLRNKDIFLKTPVLRNGSRKVKNRTKKVGQINAGVGHKIRKPKQKKVGKAALVKAALTAVNSCAINGYIKDLQELKATTNDRTKLIENKENAVPKPTDQKQIVAPPAIENNVCHNPVCAIEFDGNKKRPLSPSPEPEPDPNKRFFKFSRAKAVVTMNKNIKLQVDCGKITLMEKNHKKRAIPKFDFDSSDLTVEEPLLPPHNIDNILSLLNDNQNESNMEHCSDTKIVLQAHTSVSASDNSILLHTEPTKCAANLILSPISQMCDVTSGLALNSPKKVKNLTSILNAMPNATLNHDNIGNKNCSDMEQKKLFPIFGTKNIGISEKREHKVLPRTSKKFKNLEASQMLLDAGQKKFGVTQCTECNFVYHIGDPSDENMHSKYHEAGHVLRFTGWKNERVVADFQSNGRIIQILPEDSKIWWKKAKELMSLINSELGCYELEFNLNHSQVYLYIKSRTIIGCIVALPKTEGHRMLTTKEEEADLCSETIYPIRCGIARIWVSRNFQRQGIGTALMDVVKRNFLLGCVLSDSDIALSPATDMGRSFAKSYFKTSNYLIYYT